MSKSKQSQRSKGKQQLKHQARSKVLFAKRTNKPEQAQTADHATPRNQLQMQPEYSAVKQEQSKAAGHTSVEISSKISVGCVVRLTADAKDSGGILGKPVEGVLGVVVKGVKGAWRVMRVADYGTGSGRAWRYMDRDLELGKFCVCACVVHACVCSYVHACMMPRCGA